MNLNKKLKLFWVVMAVLAITPLAAQNPMMSGFAGNDKEIFFPQGSPNAEESVSLGVSDPHSEHCVFHWRVVSGPLGGNGRFNSPGVQMPLFYVNCRHGEYLLEVTRVSPYGYQKEYVTVTVKNHIDLLSVQSKKECWSPGDPIREDEFEFETSPQGFANYIHIHPDNLEVGENDMILKIVKFQIREPGEMPRDADITESIIIGGTSLGDIVGLYNDILDFLETLEDAKEHYEKLKLYVKIIKGCDKKMQSLKNLQNVINKITPPSSPVSFHADMEMDTIGMDIRLDCCKDDAAVYLEWDGKVAFDAGVELDVPIYPSIPKLGLMLVGDIGIGAIAEVHNRIALPKYYECYSLKIPVELYGRFGIGLKLVAFSDDILSAKGMFTMMLHGASEFTLSPKVDFAFHGVYVDGEVTVEGTFLGFNKELFKYEIEPYYLIEGDKEQ